MPCIPLFFIHNDFKAACVEEKSRKNTYFFSELNYLLARELNNRLNNSQKYLLKLGLRA